MATSRAVARTRTVTATPDPPPVGIPNPIHADDGASAAGYRGALVAGVRTYGWAAEVIAEEAGPGWADSGWADVSLLRPLFAGEPVVITLTPLGDASWEVRATVGPRPTERVVLAGTAGLGVASWFDELAPPPPAPGLEPPPVRETYTVATAPIGAPLRPLRAYLTPDAARRAATDDLGLAESALPPGRVHPWFLAARMAPLTRHNFTYGPTIHVRTQIQHLRPALAGGEVVVGATIVEAYERKGHWYQVLDGVISDGSGAELARVRHHSIFRPRGTEMPSPITDGPRGVDTALGPDALA
jgi:acyl dehydratase